MKAGEFYKGPFPSCDLEEIIFINDEVIITKDQHSIYSTWDIEDKKDFKPIKNVIHGSHNNKT